MYIQIDGIYYPNKGDQLMLFAILEKIKQMNNPEIIPVFGKGKGGAFPMDLRTNGVFQLARFQRFKIRIDNFIPERVLNSFGLIKEGQAKLVLDSGGFQFGDQWNKMYTNSNIKQLKKYYKNLKKHNTKIIFLPQAFGPFETKKSKKIISLIYKYSDLIYARDSISYIYLTDLFGKTNKIKQAPDFTILYNPTFDDNNFLKYKNKIIIIPNSKMISHTDKKVSDNYFNFLIKLIQNLNKQSEVPLLINHEGEDDKNLITKILSDKNIVSDALTDLKAWEIKKIIGNSKLVISSRYHGLISALNQGVPSFCTSWSHKYEQLMAEFGLNEYLLKLNNTDNDIEKIVYFTKNQNNYPRETQIKSISEKQKQSENMWSEITAKFSL